jgi:hypothetical protein
MDPADRRRLEEALVRAYQSSVAQEARRLADELAQARRGLAEAEARRQTAEAAIKQALATPGGDPTPHEEATAAADKECQRFKVRVEKLQPLATTARRQGVAHEQAVIEAAWRALRAEHAARREQILSRIADRLQPDLQELYANDQADKSLYDAQTGRCPDLDFDPSLAQAGNGDPAADDTPEPANEIHAGESAQQKRQERIARVLELRRRGLSLRDIAGQLSVSLATVQRDVDAGAEEPA